MDLSRHRGARSKRCWRLLRPQRNRCDRASFAPPRDQTTPPEHDTTSRQLPEHSCWTNSEAIARPRPSAGPVNNWHQTQFRNRLTQRNPCCANQSSLLSEKDHKTDPIQGFPATKPLPTPKQPALHTPHTPHTPPSTPLHRTAVVRNSVIGRAGDDPHLFKKTQFFFLFSLRPKTNVDNLQRMSPS